METFKVIKEENGVIISILRCADNVILTVGDFISSENIKEGAFIESFHKKDDYSIFPPRGTIVTNKGFLSIEDAIN